MNTLESLLLQLESLKAITVEPTEDEQKELDARDKIAAEHARISEGKARLRQLEIDRAMDEVKAAHPGGTIEALDLSEEIGFFLIRAVSKAVWSEYQKRVKAGTNTVKDDADVAADACLFHSNKAIDLRALFDKYTLAPTSISNVATRLAGFKIQEAAKRGK